MEEDVTCPIVVADEFEQFRIVDLYSLRHWFRQYKMLYGREFSLCGDA
jgi:hypothetical protein